MPSTLVSTATSQKIVKEVPAARAARPRSPAPSDLDTRDAPPTPTVVDTAPTSSRSGATRFTAASATSPTPRETNQALVTA